MPVSTPASMLSLPELINARKIGVEVQGTGAGAEVDRLLINNQFTEAAEAYRALDPHYVNEGGTILLVYPRRHPD